MKTGIHPKDYRLVVFRDLNSNTSFLIKSTAQTKETVKHSDGQVYPLVKLHITSASHPFYTGQEKMIDVEGRIDKFKNRRQAAEQAQQAMRAKSLKALKQTEAKNPKPTPQGAPKTNKARRSVADKPPAANKKADGQNNRPAVVPEDDQKDTPAPAGPAEQADGNRPAAETNESH